MAEPCQLSDRQISASSDRLENQQVQTGLCEAYDAKPSPVLSISAVDFSFRSEAFEFAEFVQKHEV